MCIRKQRDHTMGHMFTYKRVKIMENYNCQSKKTLRSLIRGVHLREVYRVLTGESWVF